MKIRNQKSVSINNTNQKTKNRNKQMTKSNFTHCATLPTISLDIYMTPEELDLDIRRQFDAIPFETIVEFVCDLPSTTRWLMWIWLTEPDMRTLPEMKMVSFIRYLSEWKKECLRSILSQWVAHLIGELANGNKLALANTPFCK